MTSEKSTTLERLLKRLSLGLIPSVKQKVISGRWCLVENSKDQPRFLVFLDFDGVLHPLPCNEHEKFRPEAIASVNRIVDELEAQIVLSTAWRMDYSIDKFNAWFKNRVIGSTPIHELDQQKKNPRFHEILNYLEEREWSHIPWVAIDDKRQHFPDESPVYITNPNTGITDTDTNSIITMGRGMKFAQAALSKYWEQNGKLIGA